MGGMPHEHVLVGHGHVVVLPMVYRAHGPEKKEGEDDGGQTKRAVLARVHIVTDLWTGLALERLALKLSHASLAILPIIETTVILMN